MVLNVQNKFPFLKIVHKFKKCQFLRLKNFQFSKKCLWISKNLTISSFVCLFPEIKDLFFKNARIFYKKIGGHHNLNKEANLK